MIQFNTHRYSEQRTKEKERAERKKNTKINNDMQIHKMEFSSLWELDGRIFLHHWLKKKNISFFTVTFGVNDGGGEKFEIQKN